MSDKIDELQTTMQKYFQGEEFPKPSLPMKLSCDDCGKEKVCPEDIREAWDAIKYVCDTYGWFFGGCNTALLCNKCKLSNPWYQSG
jgi:lysyl-tRNA synthetase class I